MIIKDQLNRELTLKNTPKRVISLVPSQTELLVDLGLEKQLVGITKFCVHPSVLRKTKTIVGGTKNVNFNAIKALNPDFILCNKEENTAEMVDELQKIAPVYVSDIYSLEDFYAFNLDLGVVFSIPQQTLNLNLQIKEKESVFRKRVATSKTKNKSIAYLIWANPYMSVGGNNFINFMIELCGFKNIFQNKGRYPQIKLGELKNTDFVFLSSEPFPFKEKHALEIKKHTKAKIIFIDGEMFSWFGSRLLKTFDYFDGLLFR